MLPEHLRLPQSPLPQPEQVFTGSTYRFTVITDGIIRCEWSAAGHFDDRASQIVVNRDLGIYPVEVEDSPAELSIRTARLDLRYNKKRFSSGGLHATVRGVPTHHAVWRYGQKPVPTLPEKMRNYGGTVRTLDDVDGAVDLGYGFNAYVGYHELNDSASLVVDEQGWVTHRNDPDALDVYVVAYGDDHYQAIRDVQRLTGPTPLLPRWALGNWWSRYHSYSDAQYLDLMDQFADHRVPLAVAILDMDWHITDVAPELGTGWTGVTWDPELFPRPAAFLRDLHERGLKTGLNLHPADGIRAHEGCYAAVAEAMGVDPATGDTVPFDAADPKFWAVYCEHVLHPLERDGVDFWWVDWQQGRWSRMPGLDPLWALNHVHFADSGRPRPEENHERRRPLTFSRFAGIGSQRYPIGFSGDTVMSWASLAFQPYFTATAANVAYGWWSHDVGGHLAGTTDAELYARWVQLGCFSPILRLHSTKSDEIRREPWLFDGEPGQVVAEFLRLRHCLVPYLHTMNHRAHHDGVPLVTPMYWSHPRHPQAGVNPAQFWFGSELLVIPAVTPLDSSTGLTLSQGFLPAGVWVDVFTGTVYDGDRVVTLCRKLSEYPVLARAGSIVPLADEHGARCGVAHPRAVELVIVVGADGRFTLVEDDDGFDPLVATTEFTWHDESRTLTIAPVTGVSAVVPKERVYRVTFVGVDSGCERQRVSWDVGAVASAQGATVRYEEPLCVADNRAQLARRVFGLTMATSTKKELNLVLAQGSAARQAAGVMALAIPETTKVAIMELLLAQVDN